VSKNISCHICDSFDVKKFLSRKNVPVHQNLLFSDQKSAENATRGDLDLVVCKDCGFIFNESFDHSKISYGEKYDNSQDCSDYFNSYLESLVQKIIYGQKVRNCSIVEIGCGKGRFLRKLIEVKDWGNKGYGFDPSYMGDKTTFDGRLVFENKYYDLDCTNINTDVIICRHVIEHISKPLNLLGLVKKAVNSTKIAKIFFETPTVEWILENHVIWDFFYEHCSYFSKNSLKTAFEISGFNVDSVNTVFNGQYLWLEATSNDTIKMTKNPSPIPDLAIQFAVKENQLKGMFEKKIIGLTRGKVAIWGAGAKGVTFANLIDPKREYIDSFIDLNSNKHGKFIPGSGHPIISYKEIPSRGITDVIVMNPNYYSENLKLLQKSNLGVNLTNIN